MTKFKPKKIPDTWKIRPRGQITICKEIMNALGWETGNYLDVQADIKKKNIVIKKR